jgi:hypothetical protein
MKRVRSAVVGLACVFAWTLVWAQEASSPQLSAPKPHAAKTKPVKSAAAKTAGLGIQFSDPYGPPAGAGIAKSGDFPTQQRAPAVEPQGGLSLGIGRDSPDGPFTGGLKFRF